MRPTTVLSALFFVAGAQALGGGGGSYSCRDADSIFFCSTGQRCASGRYSDGTYWGYCYTPSGLGATGPVSCTTDADCSSTQTCDGRYCIAAAPAVVGPSQRARARVRRRELVLESKQDLLATSPYCQATQRTCQLPSGGFECMELDELTSCGGCPGDGTGVNCLEIPGVQAVQCLKDQCVAASCVPGYGLEGGKCVQEA